MRLEISRLSRDTAVNLCGALIPGALGLIALPLLRSGLGEEKFGLFSLAFTVIGYTSFFDFGIGKSITRELAIRPRSITTRERSELFWTAFLLLVLFASGIALCCIIAGKLYVQNLPSIAINFKAEALTAIILLCVAMPLIAAGEAFRGMLDAEQRFVETAAIRALSLSCAIALPLLVIRFSTSLALTIGSLVLGRTLGIALFVFSCRKMLAFPAIRSLSMNNARRLLQYSGWVSVSNFVGPLIITSDRLILGLYRPLTDVGLYVACSELAFRFSIISSSLTVASFPQLARTDRSRAESIICITEKKLAILMALLLGPLIILAYDLIKVWFGVSSKEVAASLGILLVASYINALALIHFSFLQASGRPEKPAKLHLMELPCHLILVAIASAKFGMLGAAVAAAVRSLVDWLLLSRFSTDPTSRELKTHFKLVIPLIVSALFVPLCSLGLTKFAFFLYFALSIVCFREIIGYAKKMSAH